MPCYLTAVLAAGALCACSAPAAPLAAGPGDPADPSAPSAAFERPVNVLAPGALVVVGPPAEMGGAGPMAGMAMPGATRDAPGVANK